MTLLDQFAYELCSVLAEPGERIVDVLHGEHDAQVAAGVHWGVPVIGDHRRREKSRELEPVVAVRRIMAIREATDFPARMVIDWAWYKPL